MIMTILSTVVVPVAVGYAILGGANVLVRDMMGIEKPITTIKFKEWNVGK